MFRRILLVIAAVVIVAGCGSKTKEELLNAGIQQMEKGNANGAIVFFKNALEKNQNYFDARYQLAKAYMATGKYEQGEKEFRKVLRQDPSRADLRLELAKMYNLLKKPDQAIVEAEEYLKVHPDSAEALELLGVGYALKNETEDAERYLLKALSSDPTRISAKLELAVVHMQKGNEREARALLAEVIAGDARNSRAYYMLASIEASRGNADKALEAYRKITEINPSDVNALYRSGLLYLGKGEKEAAGKTADALLQKFPKRPEGYQLKGFVNYYGKNFGEAITSLQSSLKMQQNPGAYYFLGLSHYSRGELELALSQFRKTLDLNPSFSQARVLVSIILLKQKRIDDSIMEAKKVLQADENNALAHNILGSSYLAKGMFDEGMKELNAATALDPKLIDAHLKKGLVQLARGKTAEAEDELQTAVQVSPDLLNTRFLLASYHMRQKNYAKALSVLKEGVRGQKSDALVYNAMAAALFAENKESEGVKSLQKAKEANPDFFAPYFNLALYYASKKDTENAIGQYREVLTRDPRNLPALVSMAAMLEAKGKKGEALSYYLKAKETSKAEGYLALAMYHDRNKEVNKAISVLDEAIKADSGNTAAMEMKGKIYVKEKKYKEAVKTFEQIEAKKPDLGLSLLINAYMAMGDGQKAVAAAQKIINKKPDSADGYIVLASVHESLNDHARAIDAAKNGLRVDGKNLRLRMLLGNLYARKRDYSMAMNTYDEAVKINPRYPPAIFAQGTTLDQMGKKKDAARIYRDLLSKSPNHVPALNNLAYLCANGLGSKEEALRLATRAYGLEPSNAAVMDTMGYALLKNGKKDDARKLLEKAATLIPESPSVHYHLALACKAQGDNAQALKSIKKCLECGDFPEANAAKLLLAELKR